MARDKDDSVLDAASKNASEARRKAFAKNVKSAIPHAGITQSELAARASHYLPEDKVISKQTISHYVNGLVIASPRNLLAVAKVLGVKPNELDPAPEVNWLSLEANDIFKKLPDTRLPGPTKAGVEGKQKVSLDVVDGMASIRIEAMVPLDTALKIIALVDGK
jgi:transcriptional regulator with XRE-family HTH domain